MTFKEIKELIKLVSESDLKEVKVKNKEFEIKIRTEKDNSDAQIIATSAQVQAPMIASAPTEAPSAAPASANSEDSGESNEASNLIEIKSPMVGTFYRSPSPDKPVYTKVGESVASGSVVCIIEAMKLFNEIESEVTGKIVKVVAEDASPVEYDQVLFLVDPKG